MIAFSIRLEARDPARNLWRSYRLTAGQDLFGTWIVTITYGRIGSQGHTKTVPLADEAEACRYVRQCLKKRANAPRRLGVPYVVRHCVYPDTSPANPWHAFLDFG
jgi:predicted DNA-binding WGR domain protein